MKTEQQLDQALQSLPLEIQPPRDLWPELAARIAETPQLPAPNRPKYWHYATAASLVAALIWQIASPWQASEATAPQKLVHEITEVDVLAPFAVSDLRREFEIEKSKQLANLRVIPQEFADYQRQLAIWQQAGQQVERALQLQPDDPKLIRKLTKIQQQQIDYINRMVQVGQLS